MKALLIIDMQKGSFTSSTPRFDAFGVVNRINQIAKLFRELRYPVIYIQHDGTGTREFVKNAEDWQNLDELDVNPNDIRIDKYANDVFYRSELQLRLTALGIDELFITGCATDFCVEASVQSAIAKDFSVTIVEDGHTTGDRPHLKAEKVIEHYNWVWRNMIPTKGRVKVESTEQICNLNPGL
ncbi:MAG: isochorismatase family protein [Fulvivirga sp.]|uniref:isochorismatase family protein n=1 Tax=Fulvivirga sp. TaxID=1931237 RepID=UPI0032EE42B9